MSQDKQVSPSEDEIRIRSYLIWEREGCPLDKSEEHWQRAKAELEAELEDELRAASLVGENTTFVMPLIPISAPPSRSVSDKISPDIPAVASAARR